MKPISKFANRDRKFWAMVKFISERLGYSDRKTKDLRRYDYQEIKHFLNSNNLFSQDQEQNLKEVVDYLNERAKILETNVKPNLMDRTEARKMFERLLKKHKPKCKLPMNKQTGEKKHYAFLTGILNILTEATLNSCDFDDEPRGLTFITKDHHLIRTFSRWMDGAYPSKQNPIAVWEIKEYYGTTTFGSRVADGVYETMLDGEEFKDLFELEKIKIKHYLVVDDKFTWWDCGRSYLCRLFDMMHMGLVDEVIFGKEIVKRWPEIVKSWKSLPS